MPPITTTRSNPLPSRGGAPRETRSDRAASDLVDLCGRGPRVHKDTRAADPQERLADHAKHDQFVARAEPNPNSLIAVDHPRLERRVQRLDSRDPRLVVHRHDRPAADMSGRRSGYQQPDRQSDRERTEATHCRRCSQALTQAAGKSRLVSDQVLEHEGQPGLGDDECCSIVRGRNGAVRHHHSNPPRDSVQGLETTASMMHLCLRLLSRPGVDGGWGCCWGAAVGLAFE